MIGIRELGALCGRAACGALCAAAVAAQPVLPQADGQRHEGVASCAGAPCHGKLGPGKGAVWQSEYTLWKQEDQHAKAYQHLFDQKSKQIAASLGIGAAHESALCLDCHADHVPAQRRGAKFDLAGGVGCEACHGGSEGWLKPHDSGRSRADNLRDGMYPTDDPLLRAELCSSCHIGTRDKLVGHRLMGAGHPRISFELQVFSLTQPAHFDSETTAKRYPPRGKRAAEGAQFWAIGQAVAARRLLELFLDAGRGHDGVWPELVLFDCHACHHPMSEARWRARASTGLGPGVPRLSDASFLMLRHGLVAAAPEQAEALRGELRALHQATAKGPAEAQQAAQRMLARLQTAIATLDAWKPDAAAIRRVLDSLLAEGASGEYLDYAAAEQAALAVQALADNLRQQGALSAQRAGSLIDAALKFAEQLDNPENYDRARASAAFEKLRKLL